MTKEEILLLAPGCKLNMLIAETIFDWKKITDEDELTRLNGFVNHPQRWWTSGTGDKRYYADSFSVNMVDAWRVVEALQDMEYWLRIVAGRDGHWIPSSTVEVGKLPDPNGNPSRMIAQLHPVPQGTVPEAICKMALVAVLGL